MRGNRLIGTGRAIVLAGALAACTGPGAGSTEPAAGATTESAVGSTPEPTPTLDIVGHSACSIVSSDDEGGTLSCNAVASDPRVAGRSTWEYHFADPSDNLVMWGEGVVTNGGGSWSCQWVGLRSPNALHALDFACQGGGGYAGLWAYWHQMGDADYSSFVGWIEPRD